MGGPPGSQVAQKKSSRSRNRAAQANAEQDGSGAVESHNNGHDVAATQGSSLSAFQAPRQPNVYTTCVPLHDLYEQVRLTEAMAHGAGGRGKKPPQGKSRPFQLQREFSELPYPRGMVNNSNFCFINSILQALMFIPAFAQLAVSASCDAQARQHCPTLANFGKWALSYWKPGFTRLALLAPTLMPRTPAGATPGSQAGTAARSAAVPASQRILDGSVQEDAQEFLQKLLESIHEELITLETALHDAQVSETATESGANSIAPSVGGVGGRPEVTDDADAVPGHQKGWTIVKGKEKLAVREHADGSGQSKLLTSIFAGTLESHLQGKQRQRDRVSVLVERYYCLPVDVGFAPECTIEQALERTFMPERIYDTEREKNLKKTMRLGHLPSILFVQLRRWAVTREGELVKLDNIVHLKRTLQIPRTICGDETLTNADRTYRLLSVVCHRGDAVGRGHYVTYLVHHAANPSILKVQASDPGNKDASIVRAAPDAASVILCNDANVAVCPAKNMERESMYFLVYQKTG